MKLYTDYTGKFQLYIPLDWEYKNPSLGRIVEDGKPQAFGMHDDYLGAFQISCKQVTNHIAGLIKNRKEPIQSSDSKKLIFSEFKNEIDDMTYFVFSCAVDDHYFFASYIVKTAQKELEKVKHELDEIREILSSVKFIKPEFREKVIQLRRFDLFMASIAAVIDLQNKSIQNKSVIEYVVLSANHIDALLRLAIILTNQIVNKNNDIDIGLLFQGEGDKVVMERTIYKSVLDNKIITQELYDELELLYKERNKVVHRYVITDIRTEDVLAIGSRYSKLEEKINDIVNSLEKQQSELKVGMYANKENIGQGLDEVTLEYVISKIRDKHGEFDKFYLDETK